MKRNILYLIPTLCLMMLCACSKNESDPAEPATLAQSLTYSCDGTSLAKIYRDESDSKILPMIKGESIQFSYEITPEPSTLTYPDVIWVSSDESVVTVDQTGKVTAIAAGKSTVTVKMATVNLGVYDSFLAVVSDELVKATAISISDDAAGVDDTYGLPSIAVAETMNVTATITPEDATYKTVAWSSSDESVATVDIASGVVTGVKDGKVKIIATALDGSNVKAEHEICIQEIIEPQGIKVKNVPASGTVFSVLDTFVAEYDTYPAKCTKSQIVWTSSDENVATVEKGTVNFKSFGTVTITATCPGQTSEAGFVKEASFTLTVPAGYYNDHCEHNWWKPDTAGATIEEKYNETTGERFLLVTPAASGTNWRGDFKFYPPVSVQELAAEPNNYTFFDKNAYPIVCFRIDDVNDYRDIYADGPNRSIFIDTNNGYVHNSGSTTKIWSGRMGGGGANKWASKYKCSDGSAILVFDILNQTWQNGGDLTDGIIVFNHFKIGYADVRQAQIPTAEQAAYRYFWMHTFTSTAELDKYLQAWSAKTGITYE